MEALQGKLEFDLEQSRTSFRAPRIGRSSLQEGDRLGDHQFQIQASSGVRWTSDQGDRASFPGVPSRKHHQIQIHGSGGLVTENPSGEAFLGLDAGAREKKA
jgi:hypothetical protein